MRPRWHPCCGYALSGCYTTGMDQAVRRPLHLDAEGVSTAMPDFSGSTPIIWNDRIFLNIADGTELRIGTREK